MNAILRIFPLNVLAALLVLAGGALGGTAQYVLWATAVVLHWVTPALRGLQGFEVASSHFVERHGLVLIVAIGESVVAVGVGASGLAVEALSWSRAALLSGGVAVFLAGDALFRQQLAIGPGASRAAAALVALAAVPVGATVSAALQIGVLVVLLAAAIALDSDGRSRFPQRRRGDASRGRERRVSADPSTAP